MTLVEKALQYAQQHPHEVTLITVDGLHCLYDADKAVELCGDPCTASCLMAAQAADQQLAAMLNQLIDEAE